MKILYIHQYFKTPNMSGGTRSYEFAKHFIKNGHEVTMITSINSIKSKKEKIDGIDVIWVPNYYDNNFSIYKRLYSFIKFMFQSSIIPFKLGTFDICYATSTPLTVGFTAIILKKLKKLPYIFEVRDLWPEFPIQMGVIPSRFLQKIAYKIEMYIYKNALSIIALSPGMKDGVTKYRLNKEVSVIPNSSDLDLFYPRSINRDIAKKYNLENKFNVIHFGSMGIANGLEYIIETAKIMDNNKQNEIQFIFIGSGQTESTLIEKVKKYNLKNVMFLGMIPKITLSEIINICDISITSFLDIPILYTNSPNKLFDSLSAGKVCFVNSNGWTRELVEKFDCGFYVDPKKPEDFYNRILQVKSNKQLKTKFEKNARKLAEEKFDRKLLAEQALMQLQRGVDNV